MADQFQEGREDAEQLRKYYEHVAREGDGITNDHPDGCYWCGSPHHHSSDCPKPYDS